jgi:transposase-like protein
MSEMIGSWRRCAVAGANRHPAAVKERALEALDRNGGNVSKTSKEVGIPEPTLRDWKAQREGAFRLRSPVTGEMGYIRDAAQATSLADGLEQLACKALRVLMKKLGGKKVNLKEAAVVMGIAIDKMNVLRNRPTQINATVAGPTSFEEKERVCGELIERISGFLERKPVEVITAGDSVPGGGVVEGPADVGTDPGPAGETESPEGGALESG